jgi:NAD dependent epimerase/dehydratase family enzyme
MPWIHVDDEVGLIRHAMSNEGVSGPLNAVAPEPVTNREFTAALGEALDRPTVMKAPAFALRLAIGGDQADELLLASQRAMPVRTLESGYSFRHPLLRPALKTLIGAPLRGAQAPAA